MNSVNSVNNHSTIPYHIGYTHLDIAEHSICHPGLPLPHGASHHGSPGLTPFHRAKSLGCLFSGSMTSFPSSCWTSKSWLASLSYLSSVKASTLKYTLPAESKTFHFIIKITSQSTTLRIIVGYVPIPRWRQLYG